MTLHIRPTFKVTVNPNSFVPDYAAADQGIRRYWGRVFNPATESWDVIPEQVFEVPQTVEYRDHIKDGSLILIK